MRIECLTSVAAGRKLRKTIAATVIAGALAGAPALAADTVVIGATLPLTGPGAAYGTIMQQGMELGFDAAQKAGILGDTIYQLEIRDSQAQPGPAVSQARELIGKGAVAIVSAFTAPPLAQVPIAARSKVPVFNGGGNDPALLGRDYLWNDVMMLDQEAKVGMKYAYDTLDVRKIGILFETNYTPDALTAIEKAWADVGGESQVSATVDQTATTVGPQLEKLLAEKPDAIYLAVDGNISTLAYKELAQRNVTIPLVSYSGGAIVPEARTPGLTVYYTTAAFTTGEDFENAAKEAGITDISYYHVTYYNIAQTIVQSLKMASDDGKPIAGESIEEVLKRSPDVSFEGCCGPVSYTTSHGANGKITVFQLVDGKPERKQDIDAF